MIDRALERAHPPGSSLMKRPIRATRCRSCRCIITGGGGYLTQVSKLGQVADVVTCLAFYCRARAVVIAERDAYLAARIAGMVDAAAKLGVTLDIKGLQ